MIFTPSTVSKIEHSSLSTIGGDILYVGGNGEGNYTHIQDAIDDANNGDTVFVYNGTYYEHLVIHKSIELIGEDRGCTIIDGERVYNLNVINIVIDSVTISGFTIQNSGYSPIKAGIRIESNFNKIVKNVLTMNPGYGIWILDSRDNNISHNIICYNDHAGIYIEAGYQNIVQYNDIFENYHEFYGFHGYNIKLKNSNWNSINYNNVENSESKNCYFVNSFRTNWDENYWGIDNISAYIIFGKLISLDILDFSFSLILWIQIDLHPVKEPYDIEV
jgi:parallel beta-helix repeat protein